MRRSKAWNHSSVFVCLKVCLGFCSNATQTQGEALRPPNWKASRCLLHAESSEQSVPRPTTYDSQTRAAQSQACLRAFLNRAGGSPEMVGLSGRRFGCSLKQPQRRYPQQTGTPKCPARLRKLLCTDTHVRCSSIGWLGIVVQLELANADVMGTYQNGN